jgi:hypothetical protein
MRPTWTSFPGFFLGSNFEFERPKLENFKVQIELDT